MCVSVCVGGGRGVLMLQSAAVGLQRVDVGECQENQHILVETAASRKCMNKRVILVCFDCHRRICVKKKNQIWWHPFLFLSEMRFCQCSLRKKKQKGYRLLGGT